MTNFNLTSKQKAAVDAIADLGYEHDEFDHVALQGCGYSQKQAIGLLASLMRKGFLIGDKLTGQYRVSGLALKQWELYGSEKVMVKNLMTGKLVEEAKNTPFACSVRSEAYWCS